MDQLSSNQLQNQEELIQKAIDNIHSSLYRSTKTAARTHNIPDNTLHKRMAGRNTHENAHKSQQILSNTKEKTLVQWITRLTCTRFPASPSLVMQMAKKIHHERVHLRNNANTSDQSIQSISHNWLYHFKSKHPELAGI